MSDSRWSRLLPVSGILFVVGVIVATLVAGDPPELDAPGQQLVDFYSDKTDQQFAAAVIQAWASVLLVVFAVSVRLRLDSTPGGLGWPGALTMAGGVVTAAGGLVDSVIRAALGDAGEDGQAQVLQTLQYLGEFTFFPLAGGIALLMFGLASGILRTAYLPRPLGYVVMTGAVLTLSPLFFIGLPIAALTVIATSIALAKGPRAPTIAGTTPAG